MQHLNHAIQIALAAHDGQADKVDQSHLKHSQRVALLASGDDARTIAYLHDVVEKGRGRTLERLNEEGFPTRIISAADALTWRAEVIANRNKNLRRRDRFRVNPAKPAGL